MKDANLVLTKRSSRVGYHVLDATLMHRDNISITLDHKYIVFLRNGFLCLKKTIKLFGFVIDFRLCRVDVFLIDTLGACIEYTSSETHNFPANAEPRKDDTPMILIV